MELRTDPNLTTRSTPATVEGVNDLHNADQGDATGEGVTVAVMDTGIDPSHRLFDDAEVVSRDFTGSGPGDDIGHGTAVAGLIAALAPDARIVSLRVFAEAGRTSIPPIVEAYDWLTEHAGDVDLCNVSWGARTDVDDLNRRHRRLIHAGVQDIVAAGNTGADGGSPATAQGAFSVGAVTDAGELARFSSHDPDRDNPDVVALGRDIRLARAAGTSLGRIVDDEWVVGSGTSFSAAITTGLAARYRARFKNDVGRTFELTARDIPATSRDGEGVVDYGLAIRAQGRRTSAPAMTWDFLGTDVIHINDDWFKTGSFTAVRVDERTVKLVPENDALPPAKRNSDP